MKSQMAPIAKVTKMFSLLAVIFVAVIVAVILAIIASANVRRQRKSLGIMKSMGYSSKDLMKQMALRFMPVTILSMVIASVAVVFLNSAFWKGLFGTVATTNLPLILAVDILMILFCYAVTYIGAARIKKISVTELMTE